MTTTDASRRDRILPFTFWLSAFIIPFLVAASVLLYLLPARTDELFAWTIRPDMTAMLLASAYIGGIWFFVRVLRLRRWHAVAPGFPAVIVFAGLLAIATVVHWDRFHFGHISFITWTTLYFTTPFLVAGALVANRRVESPVPGSERAIPVGVRVLLIGIGLVSLIAGLVLFVVPSLLVDSWAWELTPLTARVVGAILTLPGAVNLSMLVDARWSSFRAVFQAQLVSLVAILVALVVSRNDLDWSTPVTGGFIAVILVALLAYGGFYVWCERFLRGRAPAAS